MEIIAGVDEAGRGPLAGPVVAAAIVLPPVHGIEGLRDSKKLTPKKREVLFQKIQECASSIGIGIVDVQQIDRLNILKATQLAMRKALGQLKPAPTRALIDGFGLPGKIIPNKGIIGGDDKIDEIKAASIIAKVTRDKIMEDMNIIFPRYGFEKHKGYGTPQHMKALQEFKASPIHRKSFTPVKQNFPTLDWIRSKRRIGELGEQLAALHYYNMGYEIVAMNDVCSHYGEIDIITRNGDSLVFVEVKTFSKQQLGTPAQKVDQGKLSRLEKAVQYYLEKNQPEQNVRLDVMSVYLGRGKPLFKRLKGVFLN
ncbi:MAG: ribonuclease HII [Fidelibacterota bacterium]